MDEKASKSAYVNAAMALKKIPNSEIRALTLFDSVVTLNALPHLSELTQLRARLARRIGEEVSQEWIKTASLSEVFSTLAAIYSYDPAKLSGENLAAAIERLVQCEIAVGGPYENKDESKLIANIQIALFVRTIAEPLPNIDAFFKEAVSKKLFENSVLAQPYFLFLFAKAYDDREIARYAKERWSRGDWQTPGCASLTLAICGDLLPTASAKQALGIICSKQLSSGFWNGEELAAGRVSSKIVITSLVARTLARYQLKPTNDSSAIRSVHTAVADEAMRLCEDLAEPVRSFAMSCIDKVCNADRGYEITTLAYLFAKSLKQSSSFADYIQLGTASVYGWVAYTIYDDFLDDEGDPAKLPLANIAMRTSLDCFRLALPKESAYLLYISKVFTAMDEANAWEVENCRFRVQDNRMTIDIFPAYGNLTMLASRSFAHALAPLATLVGDPRATVQKKRYIERGFSHYLIARQLQDDMHDWHEDAGSGQASYVVVRILRDMKIRPGDYDLDALLPQMQKQFRRRTLPKMCETILKHIQLSRHNFIKSELFTEKNELYTLLDDLERSSRESLDTYEKARAILTLRV